MNLLAAISINECHFTIMVQDYSIFNRLMNSSSLVNLI